jgi:predicted FMN-binding regulatory protein PaiB
MWDENEDDLLGTYGGMHLPGQNKSELYYTAKRNVKTQVCKTDYEAVSVSGNCMYTDGLLIAGLQTSAFSKTPLDAQRKSPWQ